MKIQISQISQCSVCGVKNTIGHQVPGLQPPLCKVISICLPCCVGAQIVCGNGELDMDEIREALIAEIEERQEWARDD